MDRTENKKEKNINYDYINCIKKFSFFFFFNSLSTLRTINVLLSY